MTNKLIEKYLSKSLSANILLMALAVLFVAAANASSSATGPHIQVSLVSEKVALTEGVNWLGILLQPEADWHTYWQNPGDSGEAPDMIWHLPQNVKAGEIQWPVPQQIKVAHLVNYGYDGPVLLMVPVTLQTPLDGQTEIDISVDLSWLVCKEDCIPGWATLTQRFPVLTKTDFTQQRALFEKTRQTLPVDYSAQAKHEITQQHILVSLGNLVDEHWQLLPLDGGVVQHNGIQNIVKDGNSTTLVLPRSDYFVESDKSLHFLLTDGTSGYYLKSQLNPTVASTHRAVWVFITLAFVGGLILNLMPCVLPILSIKALSLQRTEQNNLEKWAYPMGVILSFNLFAAIIVILKESGTRVGWGFHMQEPWMVGLLAYLFVYIALSLLNVTPQSSRFSNVGQSLISGQGFFSQFFTGVLAVIVASPCTAPFMAAALGVALTSSNVTTFAIFNGLAVGFALPLSLFFMVPALSRFLPQPGKWMETFRQFLAFPMLGTVIWLAWVFLQQTGPLSQLWLLSGLLCFSLFLWLSSKIIRFNAPLTYLLAIVAIWWPLSNYQESDTQSKMTASITFNQGKLQQLKDANQVVLVNMTADWCITCKVNEQLAFRTEQFQNAIAKEDVHYLVGDWTNKNEEILNYLNQYERAGVPLYVVYAGNKSQQVLPQILTTELVLEALKQASQEIKNDT